MQKQVTNHKAHKHVNYKWAQKSDRRRSLRVKKVINISRGSVATRVRCGGISSDHYCEFTDFHGGSNLKLDSMR